MMKYRSIDMQVVIALTIIMVTLVFVLPSNALPGRILTLPLVFILPGYATTAALFTGQALKAPKRIVFTLGLSLVIVVLAGLLLNLTPIGLQAGSWAVFLGAITLASSVIALIRRQRQNLPASGGINAWNIGLSLPQGLLLGLAALIVCGAFAVSIIGAEHQPYPGFTQLWLVPASGSNQQHTVNIGLSNMESTTMEYRLVVNVNGKVVKQWSTIDLNPNGKWDTTLAIPLSSAGSAKVEADLYRTNAPRSLYRHVVLWLT
jgi:uncharacterized membrane protein